MKKLIFLGGIFTPSQESYIYRNSKGPIQYAADALQKNLISGIDELQSHEVVVVNLPFIGSYPLRFKSIYFPSTHESIGPFSLIVGVGFANITGLKILSRFVSALRGLLSLSMSDKNTVIIYSAHLPFVLAAMFYRLLNRRIVLCQVVPDLPEFMGAGGFFYRFFKRIDQLLFYYFVKRMDFVVVLTKFMIEKMNLDSEKCLVIEGVASPEVDSNIAAEVISNTKVFLYTGTLALRYGIKDLLDAFELIDDSDVELWICGDGDGAEHVKKSVAINSRIKYFGQVERSEAVKLQKMATFLINPRGSDGEFTKYSFPSKVLEYMASGRPVIMHNLEGIPSEYLPYFIQPESLAVHSLAKCMKLALGMSNHQIQDLGQKAKEFVLLNKNSKVQAEKIINFLEGIKNEL